MLTKKQISLINSLQKKKQRQECNLFFAEGTKTIQELLNSSFVLEHLFTTHDDFFYIESQKRSLISETELKKISALTNPNTCLAIFRISNKKKILEKGLIIALDDVRDPGNLGTILRVCDWFGVSQLICSEETADIYNPKVVQASMGSIARVNVNYTPLKDFLSKTNLPIFGTFMDGKNIYDSQLPQDAVVVMGNEANGISAEIENIINERLTIPRFGELQKTESLNVAIATSIILSEFRRKR